MRIRSIRPEFWSSEDVASMDWHTRLVFIGLWSYVDDNGVGRDLVPLIVADLFPLDEGSIPGGLTECSRRVTGALLHLFQHGQITRYEVAGKRYLHITAWDKHQRIERRSAGRYPLPTTENAVIHGALTEDSSNTHGALTEGSSPGEGEKGRRGEVKTRSPADADEHAFDAWWQHYPRKIGKGQARTAYKRALKKTDASTLLAAVQVFAEQTAGSDPKFVPHASTWLNGERWADQPDQPHVDYSNLTEAEREWYVNNDHTPIPNPGGLTEAELEWEMANR